jgi:glycosyltransferase involved in cell wall biosynthesis
MIDTEKVGILTADDPVEFARSIDILLQDQQLWQNMSANALSLIKEKYNWEINIKNSLIAVYEELLK